MVASKYRRSDYLIRGLEVLASDGPDALTAARMTRELGVTKGSFYWHYRTVQDFQDELQKFWRDEVVTGIIVEATAQAGNASQVLERIGEIIRRRKTYRYDTAMRAWAELDPGAREVVRSADAQRAKLIASVFEAGGDSAERARDRTNLLGVAWRGSQDMIDPDYRFRLIKMIEKGQER